MGQPLFWVLREGRHPCLPWRVTLPSAPRPLLLASLVAVLLLEVGSARIPQVRVGSSPSRPRGCRKAPADATAGPVSTGGLSRVWGTSLMTPGEPGGGGGLVKLPCAVKPGTPPCAGLSRGPRLLGPCPSAAPGPGYPSLQPGSAQVKGEMQEDRHSCPAAAGPRHGSGSLFHLLPCPRRPCRKDRQRNRPPCSGRQLGVGGEGAAPVLSPSVRPRAGWSWQCCFTLPDKGSPVKVVTPLDQDTL